MLLPGMEICLPVSGSWLVVESEWTTRCGVLCGTRMSCRQTGPERMNGFSILRGDALYPPRETSIWRTNLTDNNVTKGEAIEVVYLSFGRTVNFSLANKRSPGQVPAIPGKLTFICFVDLCLHWSTEAQDLSFYNHLIQIAATYF